MHPRIILCWCLSALLLASCGCRPKASSPAEHPDRRKLLGTWRVVEARFEGELFDNKVGEQYIFAADGLITRFMIDGELQTLGKVRYEIRPDKSPAEFDVVGSEDDDRVLYIYRFDGPRLVLCMEGNGIRPTAFKAEVGDDQLLLTLERVADGVENKPAKQPVPPSPDEPEPAVK